MTTPSPSLNDSAALSFSVSAGDKIVDTDKIVSIDIWKRVNRIPRASIALNDGDPATGSFPFSEAQTFLPGAKISISAGYDGDETEIFSGIVVKHALDISQSGPARLVLELADPALKMTLQRKSAVIPKTSDHALIAQLADDNDLSMGSNPAPSVEVEAIVQHHASDWDLLLTRAEANGLVVNVEGGEISLLTPGASSTPVLALEYGDSILSFDGSLDATGQIASSAVKSRSWSYNTRAVVEAGPTAGTVTAPGDVDADTLAKVFNLAPLSHQTAALVDADGLGAWSSAELARAQLSRVCGRVGFQGHAAGKPGVVVTLAGLGPRFNGKAYVAGVHHSITANRWTTTAEIGLSRESFAARMSDMGSLPAGGQLPAIPGLQIGVVKEVAKDPTGDFRVLVSLPLIGAETDGVWARLSGTYASTAFGAVFYPEKGDEVILGFMNDDPRAPVILGSVYSSQHAPAYPPNAENDKKAIVTRSKLEVTFDDKDIIFEIKTPGGHSLTLDDKAGSVSIKDSNGNSLVMDSSGIVMDSSGDITLTAKKSITVKAGQDLAQEATKAASLKGATISSVATGKQSIKGATGELAMSGPLTVSGAVVKIN